MRKSLKSQIEELKHDKSVLSLLLRAYMRRTKELEKEIEMLNAILDATIAERDKWKDLAHKIDKRRIEYVRANNRSADGTEKAVGDIVCLLNGNN